MDQLKIDVWSDVVCPFCYLGKAKLEQAIKKLGLSDQVNIEWHSFQLDPDFPKNSSAPSTEHLVKRKGIPLNQIQASQDRLSAQGKNYSIDFQFSKATNFNTFDTHRLLHWAKAFNKSNALKTAFLKAHFSDGIDLSKEENLMIVIQSVGLDAIAARVVLNSSNYTQEVVHDISLARQIGITGVPFFVFNKKTGLSGAQPDSVFEEVIQQVVNLNP